MSAVAIKEFGPWLSTTAQACPDHLFLFADDVNEQTTGGATVVRDFPNAIGIPLRYTQYTQYDNPLSWFDDEDFEEITELTTQRFIEINTAVWKADSLYQFVAVAPGRQLAGFEAMKGYSPKIHAFISTEWTKFLEAVDSGYPSDEYRASASFPPIEIRPAPVREGEGEEEKKGGSLGEYKDGVFYFRNFAGKRKETRMLEASRRIHSTDLDQVLKRHVIEWGARPRAKFKDTEKLLRKQYKEIVSTPVFRGSAMYDQMVGWLGPITAPILLIRKFPSFYAIRDPKQSSSPARVSEGYISVGGGGGNFDECDYSTKKLPHGLDLVKELRLRGLPMGVQVCVAFVVPYRPARTEWEFQPPPAEVTKFTPYLKFLMASMRHLKYVVVMDRWCAQFVINAKLNYNAMKYTDGTDPPEYGVPTEHPINFYPNPRKRTLKSSAYAVFLPHPIQFTSTGKDEHTKRRNKAAFVAGVKAINRIVRPSGTAVDVFGILMGASKRKRETEEQGAPLRGEEEEEEEGEEILPVVYDDTFWVARPFRVRTSCACLWCGGCGWRKPLTRRGEEAEDDRQDDLGALEQQLESIVLCLHCFCRKHEVHRDLDWNECPSGCADLVPKEE